MLNLDLKFTSQNISDMFGVDPRTVMLWVNSGKIKPIENNVLRYSFPVENIIDFLIHNYLQYTYFRETPPTNKDGITKTLKEKITQEVARRIETAKLPITSTQIAELLGCNYHDISHKVAAGHIKATIKKRRYYVEQKDFASFLIRYPEKLVEFKNSYKRCTDIVFAALHRSIIEEVNKLQDESLGEPHDLYELEDVFNVSVSAFYKYVRSGELQSIKPIGHSYYVYESWLVDFIHSNKKFFCYMLNARPRSKYSIQLQAKLLSMYTERYGDYGKYMVYNGKCWKYSGS